MGTLIRQFAESLVRRRTSKLIISPIELPGDDTRYMPLGGVVDERIDTSAAFRRGAFYGDWMKSLYTLESFDSFSGEYQLARLLDTSSDIVWWLRLHTSMGASIKYNLKDSYYPDFLAQDKDGTIWIIEGKDALGRDNDIVQAKRVAAEEMVQYLVTMDEYDNQSWGYLIAYEDDVANSDTWADLKAKAHPVMN